MSARTPSPNCACGHAPRFTPREAIVLYACPRCPAVNIWARGWGVVSVYPRDISAAMWWIDPQTAGQLRDAINFARSRVFVTGEESEDEE